MSAPADPPSPARAGFTAPASTAALRQLSTLTSELAAADRIDDVVTVCVSHMAATVHAAVSTLMLVEGDDLVIVGHWGVSGEKARRWGRFPISDANPAAEAVRTHRPVVAADAADVRRRYPRMAPDTPEQRSVICLPLTAGAQVLGAIGLTFDYNWAPGSAELAFLTTVAEHCAQAIRRARATEDAERRGRQLRFLADASEELSSHLDVAVTLSNVAHLALRSLADWASIDLLDDGRLTTLVVAHADPARAAWGEQWRAQYPPDPGAATGPAAVTRTGRSEFHPVVTPEMVAAAARDPDALTLNHLNPHSVLIVPLLAGRRSIGAMTFIRTDTPTAYTREDLAVAEDLGRRSGVAIENARLHEHTASVALQFQRAALPGHLDAIPGWDVAAYYQPAAMAEVGGDFFDAIPHPDGSLSVFIGDVVGHGVPAAAAMAQIRSATRAFLTIDADPAFVVERLDAMFRRLTVAPFVTLVCLLLHPDGRLQFVNAGHCSPLIIGGDGPARYLPGVRPPVGVGTTPHHGTGSVTLGAADIVLLFTDGLIERRGELLDAGLARLAGLVTHWPSADLATVLPATIAAMTAGRITEDDIAAIAVRRHRGLAAGRGSAGIPTHQRGLS